MKSILTISFYLILGSIYAQRAITPSDYYHLKSVNDPQISPDGKWVAYTISTPDSAKDKSDTDIWMINWEGGDPIQLTASPESESSPRWSPDGKFLTFLSSRYETKSSQLWKMDRRGGEAIKMTDLKHSLSEYAWSPDAKKIAFVIQDQESSDEAEKKKNIKPWVIDRYHFKSDGEGYLERKRNHLYLFDVESKKLDTLTKGDFDESHPAWSPDSKNLVFVSNRTADPDRNTNSDLWVIGAQKGAEMRQLTKWTGFDNNPTWSPDGKYIAYLKSQLTTYNIYDQGQLAIVSPDGGEPMILSAKLDRDVNSPVWANDSKSLMAVVDDDRTSLVYSFGLDGKFAPVAKSNTVSFALRRGPGNQWATITSNPATPFEVYVYENGVPRRLTHVHDAFLKSLSLATVQGFTSTSKDGTIVNSLLFVPAGKKAEKLPLILWIHGGPTGQDDYSFDLTPQVLAAKGYAVATVNYRGSSGRGLDFSRAIFADWGNKEVMDLLGAVDYLTKSGIADPNRLGIGGWSYGGILTDYTTATDPRFKAAASGAGSALQLSMYGTDQYIGQYENELGVPWKNMDKWMKVSYPFLNVEKIKTPTLYMVGEKDFNVPATGSEQMYQALKSLGVPTQFIVYPGQHHGIGVPSYIKDRLTRYQDWFDKYLTTPKLTGTLEPKK